MKTYILRALVIAFVLGALGGLALTPSNVSAQGDEPGTIAENPGKVAREAYTDAYEAQKQAEQDAQNEEEEEEGGCCG